MLFSECKQNEVLMLNKMTDRQRTERCLERN